MPSVKRSTKEKQRRKKTKRLKEAISLENEKRYVASTSMPVMYKTTKAFLKDMKKGNLDARRLDLYHKNFVKLLREMNGNEADNVDIFIHIERVSKIFDYVEYASAIALVARCSDDWIRDARDWRPRSHNIEKQFFSLVDHLFSKFEVPRFIAINAWTDKSRYIGDAISAEKKKNIGWYLWLGSGKNIRKAEDLPIPLTKRAAHLFTQSPDDSSVSDAFIYAYCKADSMTDRFIKIIQGSEISKNFIRENRFEFCMSVIKYFRDIPMFDTSNIEPSIDYIFHKKYGGDQPNFSMKGRNPQTLIRETEAWHRELGDVRHHKTSLYFNSTWEHNIDIKDFDHVEGETNPKRWKITQILSGKELFREGDKMHHCVSSYARSCEKGTISIWSLTGSERRLLTVEVSNGNVRQVRGKYNRVAKSKENQIIKRWASQNELTHSYYGCNE